MRTVKGIIFKLDLNKEELNYLDQLFGCKRLIWNIALNYKTEIYQTYKRRNPCVDNLEEKKVMYELIHNTTIQKAFSKKEILKYEGFEYLLDLPNRCVQQSLNDLNLAFSNFFKGEAGYPKFKKKHSEQSIRFLDGLGMKKLNSKNIQIKVGRMTFQGKNPERNNKSLFSEDTKILSITMKKDNLNNVYASVCYECEETSEIILSQSMIGLDVGIKDSIVTSDGDRYNLPDKLWEIQKVRKIKQRRLKNKIKGSRSWNKVQNQIRKIYKKETNIRKDFQHKLSDKLTKNHGYIFTEDLIINNMTKSAKGTTEQPGKNVSQKQGLNREIQNQAWGQFFTYLDYKSKRRQIFHGKVRPNGTSQTCSDCFKKDPLSRNGKLFNCTSCGMDMDADLNGSKIIKTHGQWGLAERENILKAISMTSELETTLKI
jgi:putative transposase